jgi:glycosyltransferase involved in cell wall biosynthesis
MGRKKICFVVSSLGTAKVFLMNHIQELSVHFDVYLVGKHEEKAISFLNKLEIKEIKDIEITRNISLLKDFKALLSLRSYFKKMKFDAVHTVTPKVGLVGILAARLAGINTRIHIFTGQVWHTKKGLFKTFLMFLDRFTVFNSTHILVDGESQRQFLINTKIVKGKDSFVLGKGSISGVNTNRFVPSDLVKKEVREELGIKEDQVVFMFLGRMNTDKGINELANAFSRLRKNYKNAILLFAGGDEENMTPMVLEKVKDKKALIFYGITLTPERLLQACDVFCLPSYREGFGTSVIEASLLQKPIICSDTYGLMETIIENKTGLRHKVADSDSLFFAMEKLICNKELRELLGKGGREYVLENFSAQKISEKWVEFYRKKIFNV